MTRRLDKSWVVFDGIETREHDRWVDLFLRPDQTFGFEEFRWDAEDAGAWTPVNFHSCAVYPSADAALSAAAARIVWLSEALQVRRVG